MLTNRFKKDQFFDIGTNGLLKRAIALKIFNNLRYILTLIIIGTTVLTFSGSRHITIEYNDVKVILPAISPEAGAAVISFISFLLSKLLAERSEIISYYFGTNIKEDELEKSSGKSNKGSNNPYNEKVKL